MGGCGASVVLRLNCSASPFPEQSCGLSARLALGAAAKADLLGLGRVLQPQGPDLPAASRAVLAPPRGAGGVGIRQPGRTCGAGSSIDPGTLTGAPGPAAAGYPQATFALAFLDSL